MTGIVERLNESADSAERFGPSPCCEDEIDLMREAATTIEAMAAALEQSNIALSMAGEAGKNPDNFMIASAAEGHRKVALDANNAALALYRATEPQS